VDPATGFVVDFAVLKQAIRALIAPMDHRLLIPTGNPSLTVRQDDRRVLVDYAWPEWLAVPRTHACLIPVRHTTAELLAQWMGQEMMRVLGAEATETDHATGPRGRGKFGTDGRIYDQPGGMTR